MFGLGGQEILILLCCGGLPVVAVAIILVARQSQKREPRSDLPDDDFDE